MTYLSTAPVAMEWPRGIHWSPGEVRQIPADYPGADGDPPEWLEEVKPAKPRGRKKATAPKGE